MEAHYALEADDGTPIYIVNRGIFTAPASVLAQVDAGDVVPEDAYYFGRRPSLTLPPARTHGFPTGCSSPHAGSRPTK